MLNYSLEGIDRHALKYIEYGVSHGRQQILSHYAQQLEEGELEQLAGVCEGMSGRDLRDVCEQAERKTASQVRGFSTCNCFNSHAFCYQPNQVGKPADNLHSGQLAEILMAVGILFQCIRCLQLQEA